MAYLYLATAIIFEVLATTALKYSDEFSKLIPSLVVIVGYTIAFYFLTLVLRVIPIGITYAIWSGLGIVLVAVVGVFLFKEVPDTPAMIGMLVIILGVLIIHFFSKSFVH